MLEQEAEKEGLTISEFVERLVLGRRRETSPLLIALPCSLCTAA